MITLSVADLAVAAGMFGAILGVVFHAGALAARVRSLESWRHEMTKRDDQLFGELRHIRRALEMETK